MIPELTYVNEMAEWLDTKSRVKLDGLGSKFGPSCLSSHTEQLWYNETVSLWMTIYITEIFQTLPNPHSDAYLLWDPFMSEGSNSRVLLRITVDRGWVMSIKVYSKPPELLESNICLDISIWKRFVLHRNTKHIPINYIYLFIYLSVLTQWAINNFIDITLYI